MKLSSEKNIKVKGNIYPNDFIEKSSLHLFIIILLTMVIIVTESVKYLINYPSYPILENFKSYWIMIIILIIFSEIIITNLIFYKLKKSIKNSNLKREHIYVINNEGITRYLGEKCLFISWDNISNVIETKSVFKVKVIYKGKIKTLIPKELINNRNIKNEFDSFELSNPFLIPKRFFATEHDIIKFKGILGSKKI